MDDRHANGQGANGQGVTAPENPPKSNFGLSSQRQKLSILVIESIFDAGVVETVWFLLLIPNPPRIFDYDIPNCEFLRF